MNFNTFLRRIFGQIIFLFVFLNLSYGAVLKKGDFILKVTPTGSLSLTYGPVQIIEECKRGKFLISDKSWQCIFPRRKWKIEKSEDKIISSLGSDKISARIIYELTPDSFTAVLTGKVLPGTDAYHFCWDFFLSRSLFENAILQREDGSQIKMDFRKWKKNFKINNIVIMTSIGKFIINVESENKNWILRSQYGVKWRPPEEQTFTILFHKIIPPQGCEEKVIFKLKFYPKPKAMDIIKREKLKEGVKKLEGDLKRYGISTSEKETSGDIYKRVLLMSKKFQKAVANLDDRGLSPDQIVIIPEPKDMKIKKGVFLIPKKIKIFADEKYYPFVNLLTEDLKRYKITAEIIKPDLKKISSSKKSIIVGCPQKEVIIRKVCRKLGIESEIEDLKKEGYILIVNSKNILVSGADSSGVLYGIQTLRQILRGRKETAEVPEVRIKDWPDLEFRGVYVEWRKGAATIEEIKKLIRDTWSFFKANAIVLQIHWNDFKWHSHPEVSSPDALPLAALSEISEYSKKFHMEFIPFVFTYGKVKELLKAHPEIAEDPEWEKKGDYAYCPCKEESYKLIFDIMEEIIKATKCKKMHIAHDEIKGMGVCEKCRKIPPADLFANDVNRIARWLKERGVQTLMWGDMLLDYKKWSPLGLIAHSGFGFFNSVITHPAIKKIDKDVIICDWQYGNCTEYPTLKYFIENGFKVIASSSCFREKNNYYITKEIKRYGGMGILPTSWGFLITQRPSAGSGCVLGLSYAWNLKIPSPEKLKWDPVRIFSSTLRDRNLPSKYLNSHFTPINLNPYGNRYITGTKGNTWFGLKENPLYLPEGKVKLFGIEYLIGEKCIIVGTMKNLPLRMKIPLKRKTKV